MTIQYMMTRDEWQSHVVSLLPDACAKNNTKEDIAFDLAMEFGIIGGLVSSGWYPDEAVGHLVDREYDNGNLDDSDQDEFAVKVKSYIAKMQSKYAAETTQQGKA